MNVDDDEKPIETLEPEPESEVTDERPGAAGVKAALERSEKRSQMPFITGVALAVVVVAVLIAGLYQALTHKSGAPAPTTQAPATSSPPIAIASPPPAPAAPSSGLTDTEIVVGMAGPFSGPTKELGRDIKAGIELAFAAVNDAGGIEGRKLRLIALDDGYDPARTGPAMKELIENRKVFALVGNVGSATGTVAAPYIVGKKVPLIGAVSGAGALRRQPPDRYIFNFRPTYAEETAAAVRYLIDVKRLQPNEIVVFAQEDEFGEAGFAGVAQQLSQYGRPPELVLRLGYKRNTADVTSAVSRLRAEKPPPKAIVMIATYHAAASFIEKVREAGLRPIFTNVSVVDATALAEELTQAGGAAFTEGVMATQVVPPPTSNATVVMRYRQALEKHTLGVKPGFISLEGYVIGNIFIEGLKRAGRHLDREKLVDALEGIQKYDLGIGVPITFSPKDHQASHKVWGTVLDSTGTYRLVDLE